MTMKISKEMIKKSVKISQQIEGYETASKSTQNRVSQLREKHNVKVSPKTK